jgi:hypothetical protein
MRFADSVRCNAIAVLAFTLTLLPSALPAQQTITGQTPFADYTQQKPGVRRKITVADLPEPKITESSDFGTHIIPRPADAWPIAPAGFKVQLYAGGDAIPMQRNEIRKATHPPVFGTFVMPRIIHTAPNGDLFVADSQAGAILILRGVTSEGKPVTISTYATGLDHPSEHARLTTQRRRSGLSIFPRRYLSTPVSPGSTPRPDASASSSPAPAPFNRRA